MGVVEILEREYKEYGPLLEVIKVAAKQLVENYDKNFLTISHAADADGLASAGVLTNTINLIRYFKGYETTPQNNKVKRIMGFSKDKRNENSLTQLTSDLEKNNFLIISDLGTLVSEEFNNLVEENVIENAIINDHHKPVNVGNFPNINPVEYFGNDLPSLSASSLSAILLHYVVKELKDSRTEEEAISSDVNKQLKIIDKIADYLTILALGGDKADMQGPIGATKALYENLIQRRALKKVDSPHYGYKTKLLPNVIAESSFPFNLKYKIPSSKEIRKVLDLDGNVELSKENYEILKKLFVVNEKEKLGVNTHYMQNLDNSKISEINNIVKDLTNNNLIDTTGDVNNFIYQYEVEFNDFRDNIYGYSEKIELAKKILIEKGFEPDITAEHLEDKIGFNQMFRENIEAFSDFNNKERIDSEFNEQNYCVVRGGRRVVKNQSPGEQGTFMTAMSKMGEGELFLEGIEYEIGIIKNEITQDDPYYNEIASELDKTRAKYRRLISDCMRDVEKLIEEGTYLTKLKKGVYHLNMNPIKQKYVEKYPAFEEDFVKMVGVLGGMVTKSRIMPDYYFTLFAGTENDEMMKISARINLGPKQKVDFGEFYTKAVEEEICISGGGHREAASGILNVENFEKFLEFARKYNFNTK